MIGDYRFQGEEGSTDFAGLFGDKQTLADYVERTIAIHAAPGTVFRFFTDSTRWATWWGTGSTIDARPGGRLLIRYPDGTIRFPV